MGRAVGRAGLSPPGRAPLPGKHRSFEWPIAAAGCLALAAALWLPFGLRAGNYWEHSLIQEHVFRRGTVFFSFSPSRPLTFLPWMIAFLATPDSLVALNLIHIGVLAGKGLAAFFLIRSLPPSDSGLAYLAGSLLVVFPADQGVVNLHTTNVHAAVLFSLFAVVALISIARRFRWWLAACILGCQGIALAMYEAQLPLLFASPLLLVWLGVPTDRRWCRLTAFWLLLPAYSLFQLVRVTLDANSYQSHLIETADLGPDLLAQIRSIADAFARAYGREFVHGWAEAFDHAFERPEYFWMALAVVLCSWCPAMWVIAGSPPADRSRSSYVALAFAGLCMIPLGFLFYAPTPIRFIDVRIHLFSAVGGAVVFAALLAWLALHGGRLVRRTVLALTGGILLVPAVVRGLQLHETDYEASLREQAVLGALVEQAPHPAPGAMLLIIDRFPYPVYSAFAASRLLSAAVEPQLRLIHGRDDFGVAVCTPDLPNRPDRCDFQREQVLFRLVDPVAKEERLQAAVPYQSLVVVESTDRGFRLVDDIGRYRPGNGSNAYAPRALLKAGEPPPRRVHTMMITWPPRPAPWGGEPYPRSSVSTARVDFRTPFAGGGWSGSWTSATRSTIELPLARGSDYQVAFRVFGGLAPDILSSLSLRVNDQQLSLTRRDEPNGAREYTGVIRASALTMDGTPTRLEFRVNRVATPKELGINEDQRTLGVRFDWVQVSARDDVPAGR